MASKIPKDKKNGSKFSIWMSELGRAKKQGQGAGGGVVSPTESSRALSSHAEELCLEARRQAGLDIPADFLGNNEPTNKIVHGGVCSVVSWLGVSVRWFLGSFKNIPEVQLLLEWDCPMWFVRNFCITVILQLRGVNEQSGCVVDYIDCFPSLDRDESGTDDKVLSKATVFISYTGARTLRDFLQHMQDPKLKDSYIWTDMLCVDQFAWTGRRDEEMLAFKEQFMYDLHDWIGKIDEVALLLDHWDDLTTTLGQIWVIWEVFSCTSGNASLCVLFLKDEERRFLEEGLSSREGFQRIYASLAKIDARNAKAFRKEDKDLILCLMNQGETNGVFDVNAKVAALLRTWLLQSGRIVYERSDAGDYRSGLENNLAALYDDMGQFNEAESLHKKCLAFHRSNHGNKHPDTLQSINNLAVVLLNQGKLEEAELLQVEALEGVRESLGDNHPHTYTYTNNMGRILRAQGRLEEAQKLYSEALEGIRRVFGDEHMDTMTFTNNLAELFHSLGNLKDAEQLYKEVMDKRRTLLGSRHPQTFNNMAILLKAQGKLRKAEPLYKEALEGLRETLGKRHPETLTFTSNTAELFRCQGMLMEAEALCREALQGRVELFGSQHPDTLSSKNNLAILLETQGKLEDAEVLYRETLEGMRSVRCWETSIPTLLGPSSTWQRC